MSISTIGSSSLTPGTDLVVNGVTVGQGAGSDAFSTAVGFSAIGGTVTGTYNSAFGRYALGNTTLSGSHNSAFGWTALGSNSSGSYNVALGDQALTANTTASNNTAVGYQAGYSETTGASNTHLGYQAGYTSYGSNFNTFVGMQAGYNYLNSGVNGNNTFIGQGAGYYVTSGTNNSVLGRYNGNQGGLDIRTSSNYIVLSDGAGNPRGYFDNQGNIYVPQTYANTGASSANLGILSNGQYFRSTSALKYKQDVRDLEEIDISKFRAVRYKSKCDMDDQTKDHIGIIADEVDAAGIKELVNYGADGEVEGFQYERLTVVLLKKLQVMEATVTAQAAEIAALKTKVGA